MKMPIDNTLKALEVAADAKGLSLEDVPGCVDLCAFLTDLDVDGCSNRGFTRADCLRVLKACIAYVVPGWIGNEMKFHEICQTSMERELEVAQ